MTGGNVNLTQAVRSVFGNYANFSGRARRSEYWYWSLATIIAVVVLEVIASASRSVGMVLLAIYWLATVVPGLAVSVRRLHDTNRSGWWILLSLVPLVGAIVLLVFMCSDSTSGSNQYGASPKDNGYGYGPQSEYGQPTAG